MKLDHLQAQFLYLRNFFLSFHDLKSGRFIFHVFVLFVNSSPVRLQVFELIPVMTFHLVVSLADLNTRP